MFSEKHGIKCSILLKKKFIGLLSLLRFLTTKCMLLNKEQCRTIPFYIDLNFVEIKYYPYIITLDIMKFITPLPKSLTNFVSQAKNKMQI